MKTIKLDQDAYIISNEAYEAYAHFLGDEDSTLRVRWEILSDNLDDDGEVVERQPDEDCNWDSPVCILDDCGRCIYDRYNDESFVGTYVLDRS